MVCVILVDNSNIFIEGQKASAVRRGQHPAVGGGKQPSDPSWRIDFSRLLSHLAEGRDIHSAFLVGSRPPPKDDVWQMAQNGGFEVITHDRDSRNKEKAVDTELVAQGTLAVATGPENGVLVIASGDRDFIPLVNIAHKRGWTVEMAAFQSSFTVDGEMASAVDRTRPLDGSLDLIGHNAFKWP
ncbi:NYN domain-containing protein [Brucella intermedia]|uniref:NYN domain-containing protein n=1 Tax=Brucella intermedia TaxID=94625 RepID=UPI00046A9DF6|nr:NYN domain-containing protein [Brucella intermedia]